MMASIITRRIVETDVTAVTGPPGPVLIALAVAASPSVLMIAEMVPTMK